MNQRHLGGCHCGNIRYVLHSALALRQLPLRACQCSFCRKQGAVYSSDPNGKLEVRVVAPETTMRYRFASQEVGFLVCTCCGVMPLATTVINGKEYGIINANTLDDRLDASVTAVDHEVESPEEGEARRQRNWIGKVVFV